jgi:predicted nucleic acid-binding protein
VKRLEGTLVTCEGVIADSCYLLRAVRGAGDAVLANVEEGVFQIPFQLGGSIGSVRSLMKRYTDVPMDLADACLVHLAGELDTGRILTLDRDFEVYRWKRNRAFEILVDLD